MMNRQTDPHRGGQSNPYVHFFFKRVTQKHSATLSVMFFNLKFGKQLSKSQPSLFYTYTWCLINVNKPWIIHLLCAYGHALKITQKLYLKPNHAIFCPGIFPAAWPHLLAPHAGLDVIPLFLGDVRMVGRRVVGHQHPEHKPQTRNRTWCTGKSTDFLKYYKHK